MVSIGRSSFLRSFRHRPTLVIALVISLQILFNSSASAQEAPKPIDWLKASPPSKMARCEGSSKVALHGFWVSPLPLRPWEIYDGNRRKLWRVTGRA